MGPSTGMLPKRPRWARGDSGLHGAAQVLFPPTNTRHAAEGAASTPRASTGSGVAAPARAAAPQRTTPGAQAGEEMGLLPDAFLVRSARTLAGGHRSLLASKF